MPNSNLIKADFTIGSSCENRGTGPVVRVLVFYSENTSWNPPEGYSLFCNMLFDKNEKRPGIALLKTKNTLFAYSKAINT